MLAGLLMTVGVGVFGIYTGLVASWFLAPAKEERIDLTEIRGQLDALTRAVESLRVRAGEPAAPPV